MTYKDVTRLFRRGRRTGLIGDGDMIKPIIKKKPEKKKREPERKEGHFKDVYQGRFFK
jgi:hypothetical protein